jgi:CBS domain-containing protein
MQSNMSVGELCRSDVVCASEELSLKEAAGLMRSKHVGSLVVVRHAERGPIVTGILTDRDIAIVGVAREFDPQTLRVADVMTSDPITAHPDDSVITVLERMRDAGVRRIPLTSVDGVLVGIVALDDMLQAPAGEIQLLVQALAGGRKHEVKIRG